MAADNDRTGTRGDRHAADADDVDLDPADGATPGSGAENAGDSRGPWGGASLAHVRSRLGLVACFLAVFHLASAVIKATGPAAGTGFTSDAPAWSLLVRAAVAGVALAILRSPLRLGRLHLRAVEWGVLAAEMVFLLATQYLSVVDLIDRRDLIDAVAIQKNGVIRAIMLMLCFGVFVPRAPAVVARLVVTIAAAVIICHGVVLHHADKTDLDMSDVAGHQIVMANALFLIAGVALSTLAAWALRGQAGHADGPERIGAYRLLRAIDRGGSGEVYLAEHEVLRRQCALKFVRPNDGGAFERFDMEVQAAARLSHPNAVAIYDSGRTADGCAYCVMEYLPGLCVADLVQASGPMPASRAVYLARQVCGALAEAHRLGLVHRDLSPANVFVSVLGGRCDVVKVLDFGAVGGPATGAADGGVTSGRVAGTPEYIAPEQAVAGRPVDSRADIYGLGTLLHFMVAGDPPFTGALPADVLRAHVAEPVPALRARVLGLPADFEAVVARCLAKQPDERYADARAVADALGACGCAAEWNEARAEAWWLEKAAGSVPPRA